jgi:crossover junction endodeoxyribonuclease RusA
MAERVIKFNVEGERPVAAVRMTQRSKWADPKAANYLAYRTKVAMRAGEAMAGRIPVTGDVAIQVRIHVDQRGKEDVDNWLKTFMDACSKVVYDDDRQVRDARVTVSYGWGEDQYATVMVYYTVEG